MIDGLCEYGRWPPGVAQGRSGVSAAKFRRLTMSETPPYSADQEQPREGYGPQPDPPSWPERPERPEYGQATVQRYGPQSDQAGAAVPPSGAVPAPGPAVPPGGVPPGGRVGRNEPTRMMRRDELGL